MSDTVTSGEPAVAPAETSSAPVTATPVVTFGTSRGSGLSRGKRASAPAAPTDKPVASGDYKPTAVQVITSEREYKNPFESEQPAPAPAVAAASPATPPIEEHVAPAPRASTPAAEEIVSAPPIPSAPSVPYTPAPTAEFGGPVVKSEPAAKVELKILPPEEKKRPAQNWERSSSSPSSEEEAPRAQNEGRPQGRRDRDERPVFRPERLEQRHANNGQGKPAEPHRDEPQREEFRRDDSRRDGQRSHGPRPENRESREPRSFEKKPAPAYVPAPPAEAQTPKKSGGVLGWLKGLFSGGAKEAPVATGPAPVEQQPTEQRRFDDQHRRRRHRGGRGRNQGGFRGENRGPQNDQQQPEGDSPQQGNAGGDQNRGERRYDGGQSRRHRGGGGRGRGGYRGGERPSENGGDQQGPS